MHVIASERTPFWRMLPSVIIALTDSLFLVSFFDLL